VNLLQASNESLVFQLSKSEKNYLFGILQLYPLISPAYLSMSKNAPWLDRTLLEGLMRRERQNNREKIDSFLIDNDQMEGDSDHFQLQISRTQADWLLRVLNDLRLGSWIMMGKPFPASSGGTEFNEQTSSYLAAMQICGFFQMALLKGLAPAL